MAKFFEVEGGVVRVSPEEVTYVREEHGTVFVSLNGEEYTLTGDVSFDELLNWLD